MHTALQLLLTIAFIFSSTHQQVPITPFDSIALHDGAKVILRHGPTHQVTLTKGSLDYTSITTVDRRLIIYKCNGRCPRGYELEIEIVTPHITGISVSDGGRIQTLGTFPSQSTIALAVSNGGVIDTRSMSVDSVTAAVAEGGAIYTRANSALVASIVNGGNITYWGSPAVTRSIQSGGLITKGDATDITKPVSDLPSAIPPVPPVPPMPPINKP